MRPLIYELPTILTIGDFGHSKDPRYVFTECRDVRFKTNYLMAPFENEWVKVQGRFITVKGSNGKGYSWDGASPKFKIWGCRIGTPDGLVCEKTDLPYLYYATMLHDVIYQFKEIIPITRKQSDKMFLFELQGVQFPLAKTYYRFVRLFGWLFGKWGHK